MAKAGRKKKEEIDILIEEREKVIEQQIIQLVEESKQEGEVIVTELPSVKNEEEFIITPLAEIKNEIPEVFQLTNYEMSEQAIKWEKYIAMYKMTPEGFLEKYPYHIHRKFIEEIIEIRKEK